MVKTGFFSLAKTNDDTGLNPDSTQTEIEAKLYK